MLLYCLYIFLDIFNYLLMYKSTVKLFLFKFKLFLSISLKMFFLELFFIYCMFILECSFYFHVVL